jgi:hypothetical protein
VIQETTAEILHAWDSFYVIAGSSAAALTGLSFVVIALVAERRNVGRQADIAAFGTPTVFHLTMVLFVSVVLSAPWRTLASPGLVLGVSGVAGLGYEAITTLRAFRSTGYQPVFEDWVFHVVLPLVAYLLVIVSAVLLVRDSVHALFAIGTGSVILLLVGIHNSWDTVTYVAALKKD